MRTDIDRKNLLAKRSAASIFAFLAALVFGLIAALFAVRAVYANRAFPGVQAAGINLSGLSEPEIQIALGSALTYPQHGQVVLRDGDRTWQLTPEQLGAVMDIPSMARSALAIGRQGNFLDRIEEQINTWQKGAEIAPVIVFDQRVGAKTLQGLAAEIDLPVVEAKLELDQLTVHAYAGQIGRQLDSTATMSSVSPLFHQLLDVNSPLVIQESSPEILDASEAASLANEILSEPLVITDEDVGSWTLNPIILADMLRFNRQQVGVETRFTVELDREQLRSFIEPLAPELKKSPRNARFIFNDDTGELDLLEEAIIGRELDVTASIEQIQAGISAGEHAIPLAFLLESPAVESNATASELGISEAVSVVSSYFSGSSPERMHNIRTASSAFHGLLLAPGETLSMSDVLGDISLDTGYAEALIIYGDRTIKGVGGGVCQVSTTLFRAAFMGGFELNERHPHAYRVGYYEQGPRSPGPGFDATVFVPLVDFKFTNDSENWLLLETYIYGTQLLWKFYSTSDGRSVQWTSSGPRNVVEAPEPLYKENKDLDKGEINQVDFEVDGMDVTVTRNVSREGATIHEDVYRTHYLAWRAIYEYGPGTELPDDAKTE
jgi:vancomycin resistance protein YoaR